MADNLNPGVADDGQDGGLFGGFAVGADPNPSGEEVAGGDGQPTGDPGKPVEPKNDPSRFEHWQSVADQYKSKLNELAPYEPLINYINQNPQVIQAIEQQMLGGNNPQQDAAPQTQPKAEELKIPARPEKPANYDPVAAYQDPTSESWKYRDGMERYRDELQEYQVRKLEQREKVEAEREKAVRMEQMRKMQMAQVQAMVQTRYGLTPAQSIDFVNWMSDDANVTPDALIKLYQIVRGGKPATTTTRAGGPDFGPVSPGIGTGHTEGPLNPEEDFNKDMISRWKNRGG